MSELGYWMKASKLDKGWLGTALASAMNSNIASSTNIQKEKKLAFVGILTVKNSFMNGLASDEVGQRVQTIIDRIKRFQVIVKVRKIVSCNTNEIANTLKDWADNISLNVILTIGGAGVDSTAVTPEATKQIVEKEIPGMSVAMMMSTLKVDQYAMLFRGVCGIRNNVLIVNLPGNAKRAADCLNVLLPHIPLVVDFLKGQLFEENDLEESTFTLPSSIAPPASAASVAAFSHSTPSHHILPSAQAHHLASPPSHHVVSSPAHHLTPPSHHVVSSPAHHLTRPSHHVLKGASSSQRSDSGGFTASQRLPSHHHSERAHHVDVISVTEHISRDEEPEQLTEDDILNGDSFEGLIAKESIRVVGDPPFQRDTDAADSGVFGSNSSLSIDFSKIARRPRTSPFPEVSVDKALSIIFAITSEMPIIEKSFKDAFDHVLAYDVTSPTSVPAYDTAVLDGYAVIAADTPGDLDVIAANKSQLLTVGKAIRVTTGGFMPPGSNAVVPVEETLLVSEADEGRSEATVRFLERSSPGQHVCVKGSNIKCNEVIMKSGTPVGHLQVAMLASVGLTNVQVYRQPVVAVISFGAKLREPDSSDVSFDEIRDTNRLTLILALKKKGFLVVDMGIVNKGPAALKETIVRAYEKADVIVTTGGAAVGENDVVKPILIELGAMLHFGRVNMKPGAPTGFATLDTPRGKKFFFTLAGVPVPAYIGYYLFVLPCLRRLQGSKDPHSVVVIKARVSTDIYLDVVPEFQRVALRKDGKNPMPWADVTGRQAVSRMVSLVAADALLVLPARSDGVQCIKRNEVVDAMLLI